MDTEKRIMSRLGVFVFPWGPGPPTIEKIADAAAFAEGLGFDSVNLPWHFTIPPGESGSRFIVDPLVVTPILASRTTRVRIGINSVVAPMLPPFAWAQYFASLDYVSNGRAIAGAAIGWWHEDFQAAGIPVKERGRRTDEAIEIMAKLWSGQEIENAGRFYDATGLALDPRPKQEPLPLWVGGGLAAVERTARWGTAIMPLDMPPRFVREVLRPALDNAALTYGRPPAEIAMMTYAVVSEDKKWIESAVRPRLAGMVSRMGGDDANDPDETMIFGHPEQCAQQVVRFFEAGVDYIALNFSFHGSETEDFAKNQMAAFVEQVVPLVGEEVGSSLGGH